MLVSTLHLIFYRQGYADCPQDWEDFRKEVTRRPEFRFDFFLKSRSALDLQRRSDFLVRSTEKDNTRAAELKKMAIDLALKEERARKRALKKEMKMEKESLEQQAMALNGNELGQSTMSVTEDGDVATGASLNLTPSSSLLLLPGATASPAVKTQKKTPKSKPKENQKDKDMDKDKKLVLKIKSNKKKRDHRSIMGDAVDEGRTYNKSKRTFRGEGTEGVDAAAPAAGLLGGGGGGAVSSVLYSSTEMLGQYVYPTATYDNEAEEESREGEDTAIEFTLPSTSS
mgnify:CR=1 FL=1